MARLIRLYIDAPFREGAQLSFSKEQAHYLCNVLRLREGENILLINGREGEWSGRIASLSKKQGNVVIEAQIRQAIPASDIWICFSPLKKVAFDFAIEKATELGASRILPIVTTYTDHARINLERVRQNIIESAQQCGALTLPEVEEPVALDTLIANWPEERTLFVAAESGPADSFGSVLNNLQKEGKTPSKAAIMIGPEGGFSEEEIAALRSLSFARPICLGPTILRAETALTAALSVWQALAGSWQETIR